VNNCKRFESCYPITHEMLGILHYVHTIAIFGSCITGKTLHHLTHLQQLQMLIIENYPPTQIRQLSQLQSLTIIDCNEIRGDDIYLPNLRKLSIISCAKIGIKDINHISNRIRKCLICRGNSFPRFVRNL
jgi:Leucine-rich repeat (LRR) protein